MSTLRVDKITPYLSSSVLIEGSVIQANAATTGSNTFVGDQNIQGTITASIAEGFALVGGVGNVSTLVATSSFGGGSGAGFPFTGDAVITGSLLVSGSSAVDLRVIGNIVSTGSSLINTDNVNIQYLGSTFGGSTGVLKISDNTEIGLALDGAQWTTNWSNGPIIYVNNTPGDTYEGVFGFQNKTNYTDGRITALKPLDVRGNTTITGSLTISSSAATDLAVIGNSVFTGDTTSITGSNPQFTVGGTAGNTVLFSDSLSISSSLYRNLQGPRGISLNKLGFAYPVFNSLYSAQSSSFLYNYTDNLSATASYNVGVFDNNFTQDVELYLETTTTNGVQFKDIDGNSGITQTFLKIAPNYGSNPPLEFKRAVQVTGSVSVSDVLQLAQKNPLPSGADGQLAVSGSNLYFFSGSAWNRVAFA